MTTLNETPLGPCMVNYASYNNGNFDCSQSTGMVTMTLSPTNPTGPASANVSNVIGSFGGLTMAVVVDNPDTSANSSFVYSDSAKGGDEGGPPTSYTGHTKLDFSHGEGAVTINQLVAGNGLLLQRVQNYNAQNPSLTFAQCCQNEGGTWIVLNPAGCPAPTSIEMSSQSMTVIDGAQLNGNLTLLFDLIQENSPYTVTDTTQGIGAHQVHGVHVMDSRASSGGLFLSGLTAAVVRAHLQETSSAWGSYLTIK